MDRGDHVKMEKKQCPVCCVMHHHDCGVLIHKRLMEIKEENTYGGLGLCKECDDKKKKGFIALIEMEGAPKEGDTVKISDPGRTGRFAHIKKNAFKQIFSDEAPPKGIAFIDPPTMQYLKKIADGEEV